MKKQSLSLFIVLISSGVQITAADHHHKPHHEEINININGTEQCPAQERNVWAKIGAMGVQIAEKRSGYISFATGLGYLYLARDNFNNDKKALITIAKGLGIWFFVGAGLNTGMKAIMSQWNIPKL